METAAAVRTASAAAVTAASVRANAGFAGGEARPYTSEF